MNNQKQEKTVNALDTVEVRGSGHIAGIEDAIAIAAMVHKGQYDKAGSTYIMRPLRLMMRMKTEDEMIVAVLHDVVEDSRLKKSEDERWTFDKLRRRGFSAEVVEAVESVTDREGEDYDEFIQRASSNVIGRSVKIADLEDNMNMVRMKAIQP